MRGAARLIFGLGVVHTNVAFDFAQNGHSHAVSQGYVYRFAFSLLNDSL